jgi:hypothetical protein
MLVDAGERFEGAGEYVMGFEGAGEYVKGDGEGMLDTGAGDLTDVLSCCAFSKSKNGSSNLIWNPPGSNTKADHFYQRPVSDFEHRCIKKRSGQGSPSCHCWSTPLDRPRTLSSSCSPWNGRAMQILLASMKLTPVPYMRSCHSPVHHGEQACVHGGGAVWAGQQWPRRSITGQPVEDVLIVGIDVHAGDAHGRNGSPSKIARRPHSVIFDSFCRSPKHQLCSWFCSSGSS